MLSGYRHELGDAAWRNAPAIRSGGGVGVQLGVIFEGGSKEVDGLFSVALNI